MSNPRKVLRTMLAPGAFTSIVGAYDMLSVRIAEQAGCKLIHVGGYNLSAVRLGLPDVGYLSLPETVEAVSRIAGGTSLPVIADGDDGYGNYLNVGRLTRELCRAGVAGMHMEDQVFPKRCGHMAGKRVVPVEQMVAKIKAAVDARTDEDFVVIARTDAIAVTGYEDAMARAAAYQEAGADVHFVEAPETAQQTAEIPKRLAKPALFNWCYGGRSPTPSVAEIKAMGYRFVLFTDVLYAVSKLLKDLYGELATTGSYGRITKEMLPFDAFNEIVGLADVAALDAKYGGGQSN